MPSDWKHYLRRLFDNESTPEAPSRRAVDAYLHEVVAPAFESLCEELDAYEATGRVDAEADHVTLALSTDANSEPFRYTVQQRTYRTPNFAYPQMSTGDEERHHRAEVSINGAPTQRNVMGWSEDALIRDVLHAFESDTNWRVSAQSS